MSDAELPIWKFEKIIHEGAEATVSEGIWFGKSVISKVRRKRGYRYPELDIKLTKKRIAAEARTLFRLRKKSFPCPSIYYIDTNNSQIIMSKIFATPLYEKLNKLKSPKLILEEIGKLIRRLHLCDISHGDLTTHNILLSPREELFIIDFGLSRFSPELEHLGLDLQVLSECLTASHANIRNPMEAIIRGYISIDGDNPDSENANKVITRFEEIKSRVRYHG